MRKLVEKLNQPITWKGYFKLSGVCFILSMLMWGVYMYKLGIDLVELFKAAFWNKKYESKYEFEEDEAQD